MTTQTIPGIVIEDGLTVMNKNIKPSLTKITL